MANSTAPLPPPSRPPLPPPSRAPPPPPSRPSPPPPGPIAATTFEKALDDLLYLTKPPGHVSSARFHDANIRALIQQNLEILSLSRSQTKNLAIDDLRHLGRVRSGLKSREMSLAQIDEVIQQTIEMIAQSDKTYTVSDLDAIFRTREHFVQDPGFDVGDLDEVILGVLQKMQRDAAETTVVSSSSIGICGLGDNLLDIL